ncbi:hypothetical protein FS749_006051 [Ceratobasidium sp. UAMH 11750]|nr:hypothetical protein FS749_006051 [Ceratobasidium sp. UAMH 11750]
MPHQATVGRLVEDVFSFMNYTYWSMFHRAPREKDPDEMLRETAQKLWYIKHLIRAHERILPLGDYARLTAKQRRHRLDLVGEQAREPPYPDQNARRARISVLLKAVVELRSEALVVIEQARLPNDGIFPPDEPTPIAPVEMADGMIGSLFSKWPALWLVLTPWHVSVFQVYDRLGPFQHFWSSNQSSDSSIDDCCWRRRPCYRYPR